MLREPFVLHRPSTVDEAVRLLADCQARNEDAKLLAGGQSLVPTLNLGLAAPAHLVSLNHISGLDGIRHDGTEIVLGARTTHRAVQRSPLLRTHCPILAETAGSIGDVQVRNRGTIGGSVSHFDPAADYPAVLALLDARFRIMGPASERTVSAQDFFVDYLTTCLATDEVLIEVRVTPPPAGTGSAYVKFARVQGGFAIVGVAACLAMTTDQNCELVRIGLCGAAAIPLRLADIETALCGRRIDDAFVDEIAETAYRAAVAPVTELHADGNYKRNMVRVFTRRALRAALARAAELR